MEDTEDYYFQNRVKNFRDIISYRDAFRIGCKDFTGKRVLLVGGGVSPLTSSLKFNGIKDFAITNVDPYAEPVDAPDQILISEKFSDHKINENGYDMVLSLFSLPLYAKTPTEAMDFYARSVYGTAGGGSVRVFPIDNMTFRRQRNFVREFAPNLDERAMEQVYGEFIAKLREVCPDIKTQTFIPKDDPHENKAYLSRSGIIHMPESKGQINRFCEKIL